MIVGTAGHIDHGKTTLVRALTGVDTDRLPEEKKRGISIELGYAYLDVPQSAERLGFIDVPGHERLVHTMLAGATGIDYALLLVAADDGVMPQTREHLAVLSLLGLARGAAVVTKIDRADPQRVQAVCSDVAALLAGTALAGAPVFALSAHSGEGLPALKEALFAAARGAPARDAGDALFRLAIDRAFTLDGVGTVVTGTVHSGRVAVGDELAIVPGRKPLAGRVRSLHAQNQAVAQAQAGQRCAVALAGPAKDDIARGQWLVAPAAALATERLDASLTLWAGEAKALRSGTPVHVHVGAGDTLGTVALLDAGDALAPGATGRVQIVLRQPIGAWHGDRVVLRDASATRTLAGGRVLDPFAPARYRRTVQRLSELAACDAPTPRQRLAALVAAAPHGVDLRRWACGEALDPQGQWLQALRRGAGEAPAAPQPGSQDAGWRGGDLVANAGAGGPGARPADGAAWALGAGHAAAARDAALAALRGFHERQPDELGPDAARLRRLAAPRLPEPLWRALLEQLGREAAVAVRGAFVHLPEHGVRLSAVEERIAQKVAPLLQQAGFEGAWARDLARDAQESEPLMRVTLARLAQRGELHQVVKDLYYDHPTMLRLAAIARGVAVQGEGEVKAAGFRDGTRLGRKRAIQILEYFDRVGLLRRVGDTHKLRSDTQVFAQA
jgi:selenocysteine-specific elongation factor